MFFFSYFYSSAAVKRKNTKIQPKRIELINSAYLQPSYFTITIRIRKDYLRQSGAAEAGEEKTGIKSHKTLRDSAASGGSKHPLNLNIFSPRSRIYSPCKRHIRKKKRERLPAMHL